MADLLMDSIESHIGSLTHSFCKEILEPMTLRKLQYFCTKVLGPPYFFRRSGLKFFCIVNAP